MARSKRRMPSRRSRPRADWVYRPNLRDAAGGLIDDLGTYDQGNQTLVAGIPTANAAVLYDSHNRIAQTMPTGGGVPTMTQAARAEGGRAFIVAVQGVIIWTPTTWALGSTYRLGIRFGMFEQDPSTGAFLLDPTYSMWQATVGTPMLSPASWANDRQWQHEYRVGQQFNDNSQIWNKRFFFKVRRSLLPNFCYGIFLESQPGSVNLSYQLWFRTLVSDEG